MEETKLKVLRLNKEEYIVKKQNIKYQDLTRINNILINEYIYFVKNQFL